MKEIAQTFLLGGGIIGLLLSAPIAAYGWFMHRGFGGEVTYQDRLMLYSPFICIGAIVIGVGWSRLQKKPIQPPVPNARRPDMTRMGYLRSTPPEVRKGPLSVRRRGTSLT
jgi:hypothetical protein